MKIHRDHTAYISITTVTRLYKWKIILSKEAYQTLTPPGKQKEAKSFKRIASFFPGGYLKSTCEQKIGILSSPTRRGQERTVYLRSM